MNTYIIHSNVFYFAFVCLVDFLTSLSTTRLYRGRVPRLKSDNLFYVLLHTRQKGETITSVSAGHIILTPTQSVGSWRPQRESNPVTRSRVLYHLSYRAPILLCKRLKARLLLKCFVRFISH